MKPFEQSEHDTIIWYHGTAKSKACLQALPPFPPPHSTAWPAQRADFFSSLPAFCLFLTAEPGPRLDQVDSLIHETRKRQIPKLSRQTAWQYNSQYGPEHDFYPGITWKGPARSRHFYTEIGSSVHVSRLVYSPSCMASVITWKISSRDTGITTGILANRAGSVTKLIFIAFN